MGERAFTEEASEADLQSMKREVRDAIRAKPLIHRDAARWRSFLTVRILLRFWFWRFCQFVNWSSHAIARCLVAVAARLARPAWRKPPRALELERACSFYYPATVLNDNTVRVKGRVIDIPPGPRARGYAHARVEVRQLLDGSWRVYYQDRVIATAPASGLDELSTLKRRRRPSAAYFRAVNSEPTADHLEGTL